MIKWYTFPGTVILLLAAACSVDNGAEQQIYRDLLQIEKPELSGADPLTLRETLRIANQNNENLAVQGEQYLRSLIARRRTAASFLPTVNLVPAIVLRDQGSQGAVADEDISENVSRPDEQGEASFDLAGELDFTLFNGFRDVRRYWRDTFLIEQRRNDLLAFQEGLLLDVTRIFFQVLRSEESVRVLQNSIKVQEERARTTGGRFQAGLARALDVSQTESQVAVTRTSLINAERDVRNARELLTLLAAAPLSGRQIRDDYVVPDDLDGVDSFISRAVDYRRELHAAEAAVGAARQSIEIAWAQYYPTVSLNFSAFLSRETAPTEREWQGVLSANLPLFTGGRIHADVREAWSFVREALLVQSYLRRDVEQQVRAAHSELVASRARLEQLRIQLLAAEQTFRQAEASYQAGLATNLDQVAAQDALLVAQLQLASEEFNHKTFYLGLLQATGVLREELEAKAP